MDFLVPGLNKPQPTTEMALAFYPPDLRGTLGPTDYSPCILATVHRHVVHVHLDMFTYARYALWFGAMANDGYWDRGESRELAVSPSISPTASVEVLAQRHEMPLPLEVAIACAFCAVAVLLFHRYRKSKTGTRARRLDWRWKTLQKVTTLPHLRVISTTPLSPHHRWSHTGLRKEKG